MGENLFLPSSLLTFPYTPPLTLPPTSPFIPFAPFRYSPGGRSIPYLAPFFVRPRFPRRTGKANLSRPNGKEALALQVGELFFKLNGRYYPCRRHKHLYRSASSKRSSVPSKSVDPSVRINGPARTAAGRTLPSILFNPVEIRTEHRVSEPC